MKTCTKCKCEKPLIEFYKCSINKDGLRYECKYCFPKPNKEKKAIADKKYSSKNKDKRKIIAAKYYERNKNNPKILQWKINNPEKYKSIHVKSWKKTIALISNSYAKKLLYSKGFTKEQVNENPQLIETIKIIIKTKRICKTS